MKGTQDNGNALGDEEVNSDATHNCWNQWTCVSLEETN